MANLLNGFLDNLKSGVLSPKGNLGDFAHAARLYVDDSFRLAPKVKFLYHVTFNLNKNIPIANPPIWKHGTELNMLVKGVELPKYSIDTDTVFAYNKKRKIHKKIQYDPINVVFHDDNYGVTTALWECYFRYYFKDGNYGALNTMGHPDAGIPREFNRTQGGPFNRGNSYLSSTHNRYRFGLDAGSYEPFFHSIQIYQMARKTFTCFTLVNPIISSWTHDSLQNGESGPLTNMMGIEYETVFYSRGKVVQGSAPKGFALEHYDKTPSPNSLRGGGTTSVFGQGGILSGLFNDGTGPNTYIGSQLGAGGGKMTLGAIIRPANRIKNAKNLSKGGLMQEGFNILTGAIGKIGGTSDSSYGVANTVIGRSVQNVRGGIVKAIKGLK